MCVNSKLWFHICNNTDWSLRVKGFTLMCYINLRFTYLLIYLLLLLPTACWTWSGTRIVTVQKLFRQLSLRLTLSLSCSMGSMPVGVHDIFHEMAPFPSVHRQSVQGAMQISLLHQSTRSYVHLLLSLPLSFLPSIMPKTACFRSLSSCILHMWPKKFNFLSIILCTILMLVRPFHDIWHDNFIT